MNMNQHIRQKQYKKGFVTALPAILITVTMVTVGYFALHQKNSKPTKAAKASTTTSTITDAEARAQLKAVNTCNYPNAWSRSDCVNASEPQTSLKGIHQAVLTEVISLKNACDVWTGNKGPCNVGVTGGTEITGGHEDGACRHLSGDKVDILNTASVNNYILAKDLAGNFVNFTQIADRQDKNDAGAVVITAQYKNKATGVTYAQELTHWDIGGVGCTK